MLKCYQVNSPLISLHVLAICNHAPAERKPLLCPQPLANPLPQNSRSALLPSMMTGQPFSSYETLRAKGGKWAKGQENPQWGSPCCWDGDLRAKIFGMQKAAEGEDHKLKPGLSHPQVTGEDVLLSWWGLLLTYKECQVCWLLGGNLYNFSHCCLMLEENHQPSNPTHL